MPAIAQCVRKSPVSCSVRLPAPLGLGLLDLLRGRGRLLALALALSVGAIAPGCAHASEDDLAERDRAHRQEMDVMKERVHRLERKISDLDTKMTLLLERSENAPAGPSRVSSGPSPYAQPRVPIRVAPLPTQAEPTEPKEAYTMVDGVPVAVGPGARPFDLPSSAPELVDPEPSEPLVVRPEADDGPPVVIDKAALARLEQRTATEPLPAYSRQPNREVTRADTRPGPAPSRAAPKRSAAASTQKVNSPMPTRSVKKLYQWAMARREEGNHAQAIGAFDELQKRWPQHHLADNAIYWSGVSYQASGNWDAALRAYKRLPMVYPKSPKIPDALYGMAEVHEHLGNRQTAIALYAQLIDQYPRAERAAQARSALQRLRGG